MAEKLRIDQLKLKTVAFGKNDPFSYIHQMDAANKNPGLWRLLRKCQNDDSLHPFGYFPSEFFPRPIIPQHPRIQNLEHRIYDFQTLLLDLKLPVPSTPPGRFDRLWPQMEKRTNWILLWDTYFTITKDSNTNWFPRHSQGAQIPPYHLVTVYTTFESDYFRSKDSV